MISTNLLSSNISQGLYNQLFSNLYGDNQTDSQKERYQRALSKYGKIFGEDEVAIYSAPGRTEIGGNHTDHQNGMVLAAAINLDAIAVVGHNDESEIRIISEGYEPITISLDCFKDDIASSFKPTPSEEGTTLALIKGVADGFLKHGYQIGPFKAYITSDVLNGAGLSSSAAFETLIGTIFSGMFNDMNVSLIDIAKIGQYAENVFFGKPCGLMDQMACSVGNLVHIDFLDKENPVVHQLNYDFSSSDYTLCIVDTKGSHADLTPDYAAVPAEMKSVAAYFGKEVLTEVSEEAFYENISTVRSALGDRAVLRAIHFYNENKRVQMEVNALAENDFEKFLGVFKESANSSFRFLQNVYSNHDLSNQAVAVALALSENILGENGVCRVHGGGFAGTIQVFMKNEFVETYKNEIEKYMGEGACQVLKIRGLGGVPVFC